MDGEFLRDYARFYSRAYGSIPRYTMRYHFFSEEINEEEFKNILSNSTYLKEWLGKKGYESLEDVYLGFVVKKPVKDQNSQPLLGRTAVRPYCESSDEGYKRVFIKSKINLSLFGIPLTVETTPFINQDEGVGVCAAAAIWITNGLLNASFGLPPEQSLAEITEMAHRHPGLSRTFPSQGFNIYQVIHYFKSHSLDVEVVNVKESRRVNSNFFMRFVKAFVDANIPVIAVLNMYQNRNDESPAGRHAAVITGYKFDPRTRRVVALYVHDDQIGPYAKVSFSLDDDGKSIEWKYEKNSEWNDMGYTKISVPLLIVPVYPKIRLAFSKVYGYADELLRRYSGYEYDISLKNVRDYKQYLWMTQKKFWWHEPYEKMLVPRTKWELLELNMPRFLWIIRTYKKDRHVADVVLDATAVHPRVLFNVYYPTDNTTKP